MNVSLAERVLDIFANAQNRRLTQAMIDDAVERKRVSLASTKALKGKPKEQKKRLDEFAAKLAPSETARFLAFCAKATCRPRQAG